MRYKLRFKTATIVEITPSYIGVLMDGSVHYNIGITNNHTAFDIKRNILNHASEENGLYLIPFSRIEEIPEEIRNQVNKTIDLDELKEKIIEEEDETINAIKTVNCDDVRNEILPDYMEFIEALYEKEIKKDSKKYNELLERIEIAYKIFPKELGENIPIKQYEEIIDGL